MLAIEDAATSLVLEHGYDCVTVDQICAAAQVSKRTFFNYVPSKEAAVIGSPPRDIPRAGRREFLDAADPDVPGALLRLFLATFAAARIADDAQTATLAHRRAEIVRANPDLGVARVTASSRVQLRLVDLVTEHFERHPALRRLDGVAPRAEARAYVALVAASANLGLSTWLTREAATFAELDAECALALRQLALLVTAPPDATPAGITPAGTTSPETTGTTSGTTPA
nr:TetR/AcrR family transcriptional regulator [Dietzia sp. CQ4]